MVYITILICFILFTFNPINSQTTVLTKVYSDQNDARAEYGLESFEIDQVLVELAKSITDQCDWYLKTGDPAWKTQIQSAYAEKNGQTYDPNNYNQTLGLNMGAATVGSSSASWVNQKTDWDCENNTCAAGEDCLGWTQTIWEESTKIGCAITTCTTGSPFGSKFPTWEYLMCLYNPAGNMYEDGMEQHPFGSDLSKCSVSSPRFDEEDTELFDLIHRDHRPILSVGAIVGIVVGIILAVALFVFVVHKIRSRIAARTLNDDLYRNLN